jgi:glycosyltransferase involved in cell wall biosynthesis
VQPLVGVVTPVHNGEAYLVQCIESVLKQTYGNWQYTIVNNGSTDRSLEIAQRYAATDPRIIVHDNASFLTQTQNFNTAFGLVSPNARYFKMVQADDWIFPQCLERMVEVAEANPNVGIVSSYQLQGVEIAGDGLPFPSTVVPGRELCRRQLLHGSYFFGSATALLYRGEVVRSRKPFYDEAVLHQDADAAYSILREWDFGFAHQVLTFYRTDNEGVSAAARNFNPNALDRFMVLLAHGREFLSSKEFEDCFADCRRRYFRYLGRGLFFPNGWRQLRYHRDVLKTAGFDLTLSALAPYILIELGDLVLNPKKSVGQLLDSLRDLRTR